MRFTILMPALCCLVLALPVAAAPATGADAVLQHEPVLKQYEKFDQTDQALPDPHAGHELHQAQPEEHQQHQHAAHPEDHMQHDEHQHMHMLHGE